MILFKRINIMSKINSDDLFRLIKSLSKAEKRHFKIFTSARITNKEKNYVRLFDAIDGQSAYNEKQILKEEKYIKRLPMLKNRLYEIIFQSLGVLYSNSSVDAVLLNYLYRIKFLFDKELYKQCEKIIIKAKTLAEKYEKHLMLLEFSEWEFQLIRAQTYRGKTENEMEEFYEKIFSLNKKYIHEKEYERLSTKMFVRISKVGFARKDAKSMVYEDIIKHPLLDTDADNTAKGNVFSDEQRTLTYQALFHYYMIHGAYCCEEKDYPGAYSYTKRLVKLMEDHPLQLEEKLHEYVHALHNHMIDQSHLKKHDEILLTIQKTKKINTKSQHIKDLIFFISNNMELSVYINKGEFDKGIKLVVSIQDELDKIVLPKIARMILYFDVFCIYFGIGNYRQALVYLNKIINDSVGDLRNDLQCFSKIINLIVHFELGNYGLLEYEVKSTSRFLYKRNRLYAFETSVLNFIGKKIPKKIQKMPVALDHRSQK